MRGSKAKMLRAKVRKVLPEGSTRETYRRLLRIFKNEYMKLTWKERGKAAQNG